MHISTGVAKYESSVALAEMLATVTPRGLDLAFFGNSGAEAVEGAIKLARQTTGREAIITFRGGFHGRTVGAATLTTSKAQYRRGYGALLPEVYVAPYPYALACALPDPHDAEACAEHCYAELEAMLEHEVPPEHVAAIFIEPVLGEGGYVAAPASFLGRLRELASQIGALLVFDEVQTGMGRTGVRSAAAAPWSRSSSTTNPRPRPRSRPRSRRTCSSSPADSTIKWCGSSRRSTFARTTFARVFVSSPRRRGPHRSPRPPDKPRPLPVA